MSFMVNKSPVGKDRPGSRPESEGIMRKHKTTDFTDSTDSKKSVSKQLLLWARGNDWYRVDIQTNQLRLQQAFGQAVEAITKELDYQNQPKVRRQVFDCYDMLMAKSRQIDMVCRTGCRSGDEILELEFLRTKAIAAAVELAEVLSLLQKKSGTTDFTDYTERHKTTLDSPIRGNDTLTGSVQTGEDWITFTQAAEIIGVSKGTISKWAAEGRFKDNGRTGQKRRLLKSSVLVIKQEIEDNDLKKDIRDLRHDARKLG